MNTWPYSIFLKLYDFHFHFGKNKADIFANTAGGPSALIHRLSPLSKNKVTKEVSTSNPNLIL